jgi:hypothetical protein
VVAGDGALLRGRAAAFLLGVPRGTEAPAPEVLIAGRRRVAGLRIVRARRTGIDEEDRAIHRSIPVTTVPRTLVDLAQTLPLAAVARACHEAGVRHGGTPATVERALQRRPTAPGATNPPALSCLMLDMRARGGTALRCHSASVSRSAGPKRVCVSPARTKPQRS